MHFDLTVRLGDLLIAAGFLGAAFVFYGRFAVTEQRVNDLWQWWTDNVALLTQEPVRVKHKARD